MDLPEGIKESLLISHFQKFGEVKRIEIISSNTQKNAKITLFTSLTYQNLTEKDLKVGEKLLKVKRIFDDDESESQLAERKVCVLGIPKSYKSRKLKKIFSLKFGKVEKAYIRKNKLWELNYGFVVFGDEETALKIIEMGIVTIDDRKIQKVVKLEVIKFDESVEIEKKLNFRKSKKNGENIGSQIMIEDDCYIKKKLFSKEKYLEKGEKLKSFKSNQLNNKRFEVKTRELQYLSQFKFMSAVKLQRYLEKIKKSKKISIFSKLEIERLELFYFNEEGRTRNSTQRMLRSGVLRDRISRNHSLNNLSFNHGVDKLGTRRLAQIRHFYGDLSKPKAFFGNNNWGEFMME